MKYINLLFFLIFSVCSFSQIERVDPPNWWVGFKNNELQLMIKGEGISKYKPSVQYSGIEIKNFHKSNNSDNYLFLDLEIKENVNPGLYKITFLNLNEDKIEYNYELKRRIRKSSDFIGFDNSDVVYLITPDRFSNGDIKNDSFEDLKETNVDRGEDYSRHGGDLMGIYNNVKYIKEMGFSAIWTNPFVVNDMYRSSYHGYSITDHYRIDPRFGTLKEAKLLSKKLSDNGIKLIMDQIVNHCGLYHWWMDDLPFTDWVNYQKEFEDRPVEIDDMRESELFNQDSIDKYFINTNHKKTTSVDMYASKYDKEVMNSGWFVSTMPDLNHKNIFMSKYLIQNSIWWIETLNLGGIRQDTYPYGDKFFMKKWAGEIMKEYPNFSIVGEEWNNNPLIINYWHKDSKNRDGYSSNLKFIMDFPLQEKIIEGINENENWNSGLIKLYEGLANDFYYNNPNELMIFIDNHDINRAYTTFGQDITKMKMAFGYILTLPRIPQILYGTEILMHNSKRPGSHGRIRKDFPGGWPGDKVNGFSNRGLNSKELEMKDFFKKLIRFRKNSKAIIHGETIHFAPFDNVYVMFRVHESEKTMVILNKNKSPYKLLLERFSELGVIESKLTDVLNDTTTEFKNHILLNNKGFYLFTFK